MMPMRMSQASNWQAHLEAMLRYEGYYGYVVECSLHQDYMAAGCRLILRFFSERGGAGRPQ